MTVGFFETKGKDIGKLSCQSGYYDGIYLEIISWSGQIKNINDIILDNYSIVETNGAIYASSLTASSNVGLASNVDNPDIPPDNDYDNAINGTAQGMEQLNAYIQQALSEFDSSYLQYHAGKGLDSTTVLDMTAGCGLITVVGQPITIGFIDSNGEKQLLQISATPENIKWAINKLRR